MGDGSGVTLGKGVTVGRETAVPAPSSARSVWGVGGGNVGKPEANVGVGSRAKSAEVGEALLVAGGASPQLISQTRQTKKRAAYPKCRTFCMGKEYSDKTKIEIERDEK